MLSMASLADSDGLPAACSPDGSSLLHVRCADWNAGASALIAFGMTRPAPGVGSGKPGTPCARMHRAIFSAGSALPPLPAGVLDPPHAASASALPRIRSDVARRERATAKGVGDAVSQPGNDVMHRLCVPGRPGHVFGPAPAPRAFSQARMLRPAGVISPSS